MYNGIGLVTPRGSGTSGHVQNNKFNLRGHAPPPKFGEEKPPAEVQRQPNKEILEHNRKRAIEIKLAEYQDDLEDKGCVCVLADWSATAYGACHPTVCLQRASQDILVH